MEYSVINAFASPVRLKLLCCLSKRRKNVAELITECGLSQSAVSQHLTKLKDVGLVKDDKEGKYVYYSLMYPKAAKLAKKIQNFIKEVTSNVNKVSK